MCMIKFPVRTLAIVRHHSKKDTFEHDNASQCWRVKHVVPVLPNAVAPGATN